MTTCSVLYLSDPPEGTQFCNHICAYGYRVELLWHTVAESSCYVRSDLDLITCYIAKDNIQKSRSYKDLESSCYVRSYQVEY